MEYLIEPKNKDNLLLIDHMHRSFNILETYAYFLFLQDPFPHRWSSYLNRRLLLLMHYFTAIYYVLIQSIIYQLLYININVLSLLYT